MSVKSIAIALVAIFTSIPALAQVPLDRLKESYRRPATIPFPANAPYSPQMATLGKMLFFDARLSGAENMSCASCHNPSFGYEMPVRGSVGNANLKLSRQAPTVLNAAWLPTLFWDGRAKTLEEQAAGPITADGEMNGKFADVISRLKAVPEYRQWFERLFAGGVGKDAILTAIATYERTVVAGWAPFDRWIDGDDKAISESAQRGFVLFNGAARCSACHGGWNFTDNKFHDIGIASEDIGRAKLEPNNPKAKFAFKTPGLRNLTYRAPFMHNGLVPDLEAVVVHYESGGIDRPSRSDLMGPIAISEQGRKDLVEFLKSLTADKIETPLPNLPN